MKPTPYLFFNGQCRDAVTAYARIFGVPMPKLMTMNDAPPGMDIPEDRKDWIMHCEMEIGEGSLMLSDDFMGNTPAMEGCNVMVSFPTAAEAKLVFEALAEGGEVRMPWEPTFWSAGFGALTDRFGIRWMVDCAGPPPGD